MSDDTQRGSERDIDVKRSYDLEVCEFILACFCLVVVVAAFALAFRGDATVKQPAAAEPPVIRTNVPPL